MATVPTFERRDTAVGAKPTLAFSQIHLSRASFATGGVMSSHDSFAASGSSPTRSDFICENHLSIFLLRPISPAAFAWIEEHLPPDRLTFGNAVVIEPRFVWAILVGLQEHGLMVTRG
jgi:hypothetical protein